MAYTKPHLTFDLQVQKLTDHGLICTDGPTTVQRLRAVGYYRLSAYVYPFRELHLQISRPARTTAPTRSEAT